MSEKLRQRQVHTLSLDISTSSVKVMVMGYRLKDMDIVSVGMRGAVTFFGQPAFDLQQLPKMIHEAIQQLEDRGWIFPAKKICICVRQHDLVVLNNKDELIIPSLSWQCNAATVEVAELNRLLANMIVGKIEERFILPKLAWLLKQMPELRDKIGSVMSLDAYIAFMLTGKKLLSSSEAMSNGLVDQITGELSVRVIKIAGLRPGWFPKVVPCGTLVGKVTKKEKAGSPWRGIIDVLEKADVYAGKGDNDSSAAGCGLNNRSTIIVSMGTSGTVLRKVIPEWYLAGNAACFEYFGDRLLLMMLKECGQWYDDFCKKYAPSIRLADLDYFAETAYKNKSKLLLMEKIGEYPDGFNKLPMGNMVASVQASIIYQLLLLIKKMLKEVKDANQETINKLILTGGLSRSPFIRRFFQLGLSKIDKNINFNIGSLPGKFAFETAALGALITARASGNAKKAFQLMEKICSTNECIFFASDIEEFADMSEKILSKL